MAGGVQIGETNLMATIPEPEISRNFRTIGGIRQRALARPNPKSKANGFRRYRPGGHSLCSTEQPPARRGPPPPPPHGDPGIPGSPASSGPFSVSRTPLTSLASDVHVKKDSGVTRVGGLSLGGRVRHCDLQTRLEADSRHLVAAESPKPQQRLCPRRPEGGADEPLPASGPEAAARLPAPPPRRASTRWDRRASGPEWLNLLVFPLFLTQ